MAKRFTDTEIWKEQKWFKALKPIHKLIFLYLKDNCDHAGLWKVDAIQIMDDIGLEGIDIRGFIEACNKDYDPFTGKEQKRERIRIVNDHILWITGFVQFQYENKNTGRVNPNGNYAISAINLLKDNNLYQEALNEDYITLTKGSEGVRKGSEGMGTGTGKGKGKGLNKVLNKKEKKRENKNKNPDKSDTEEARVKGCPVPEALQEDGFAQRYNDFWDYLEQSKRLTPNIPAVQAHFRRLLELKNRGHPPMAVIDQTMSAGNKSLYPLKDKQFESKQKNNGQPNIKAISDDVDRILRGRAQADNITGSDG